MSKSLSERKQKAAWYVERPKVVAYELAFDIADYERLARLHFSDSKEYEKQKSALNARTKRQLKTHIGERFNVLLSKTRYEIINGQIYAQNTNKPFINSIIRGRDYRKLYGNPIDWTRENAEVEGFTKIQQALCSPDTRIDTMMLSISPRGQTGSIYQHNFYDIFTLREDENGRFIEARRYSSALSNREYAQKVSEVFPQPFIPTDVFFLASPIQIDPSTSGYHTPDDIHKDFHRDHEYMLDEEFREVIKACTPLILSYINTLCENPSNIYMQRLTYNAILNKADYVAMNFKRKGERMIYEVYEPLLLEREIYRFGKEPVRQVMTACGPSGGSSNNDSFNDIFKDPFSVSEFGLSEDKFGSREVVCPKCGRVNIRPENELLPACQHCGSKEIACK